MAKDFSELVEYLDTKFTGIDEHFEAVDDRMDRGFAAVNAEISGVRT